MSNANSAARRFTRHRRPPPFAPTPPSADYLALSEIPSTRLPPDSDKPESRKLLVLDLNGTLVLRSPRTYTGPRTVMPRPFSKTFKEYIFREGSHLDVMVWSSAQPHSVDSMLDSFFGSDRSRLVGIWARDTLGLPSEHYSQKVQTIKDLNIIWKAPAGLPPPVKVMPPPPMAILTDDPTSIPGYDPTNPPPEPKKHIYSSFQLMPETTQQAEEADRTGYFETPEVKRDDPIPGLSTIDADISTVECLHPAGIYSALNSILLDDSALKAHLQPYNHLTLPEYTADLRTRDVRREHAIRALTSGEPEVEEEDMVEEGKAGAPKDTVDVDGSDLKDTEGGQRNGRSQMYKHLRAAPYDKSLLGVIGVLDAIRYESSIIGWMKAGGVRPSQEEMKRVAALFSGGNDGQSSDSEEKLDQTREKESDYPVVAQSVPAKRSSDSSTSAEQESPKRSRPNSLGESVVPGFSLGPTNPVIEGRDNKRTAVGADVMNDMMAPVDKQASNPPVSIRNSHAAGKEPASQPTKRKRHRVRQKPTYPADHPLSANDSYPFFTDGKSETKLWFQDRDTFAYWVRRGLLALKECGIEPEAGVDVNI